MQYMEIHTACFFAKTLDFFNQIIYNVPKIMSVAPHNKINKRGNYIKVLFFHITSWENSIMIMFLHYIAKFNKCTVLPVKFTALALI